MLVRTFMAHTSSDRLAKATQYIGLWLLPSRGQEPCFDAKPCLAQHLRHDSIGATQRGEGDKTAGIAIPLVGDERKEESLAMPEKKTIERARRDKREGKSASTQAGEFVREEIEHIRQGKHGARSTKPAIAIGLSKARRAGVDLPPPEKGKNQRANTQERGAGLCPRARRSAKAEAIGQAITGDRACTAARRQAGRLPCGAFQARQSGRPRAIRWRTIGSGEKSIANEGPQGAARGGDESRAHQGA